MLAAVDAWQRSRVLALGLVLWSLAVVVSIVYLGEHYVVDALVSIAYVVVATAIVEIVSRRRARRVTPATPSA
jgi:membrane-associated phospholipid phosphatase